ncbi:MAG: hypothetical protein F4Y02_05975 [Chloroflexi bacterium]|nr:hypothetical protein [Chloroflexota bacterium]
MSDADTSPPESLRDAVASLWRTSIGAKENILDSTAFKHLKRTCTDIYLPIEGSRLRKEPTTSARPDSLLSALDNFFRWNGAPWHGVCGPGPTEVALRLHRAFLCSQVSRTFLVPLDRLYLLDASAHHHQKLENVAFGPNEVTQLTSDKLIHRIPHFGLKRFGQRYEFPVQELGDRCWLITTVQEDAGAIWKRNRHGVLLGLLNETMDSIGKIPVFRSALPSIVEEAVLILLLSFIKRDSELIWKPFGIPWTYSYTDDPFADPRRAPDPSVLSWTLTGDPGREFEVSDLSNLIALADRDIQALRQRWKKLHSLQDQAETRKPILSPLAVHFFLKAFFEDGIDEVIALIGCIEALLLLQGERNRTKLMTRYQNLVNDGEDYQGLDGAYRLRRTYLHGLAPPDAKLTFHDLARARVSVATAMDAYLSLASQKADLERTDLLRSLNGK